MCYNTIDKRDKKKLLIKEIRTKQLIKDIEIGDNKMMKIPTVKKIMKIKKSDILIPEKLIMRPLQDQNDEDIGELATSFKSSGMINEIDVRESKTIKGKYELIAGARRFVATKEDTILAKIFDNISDLKVMTMGFNENKHRKEPDSIVRDTFVYSIWKKGKEDGEFKYVKDMATEIGMGELLCRMIVAAGELKEKDSSPIIQNATARDLDATKELSDHPDLRQDILKKKQDNLVSSEDMGKISDEIKSEIVCGTEKEIIKKALDIVSKPSVVTNENEEKENKSEQKISERKFTEVLKTYKDSPDDVKKKLEKKEIGIKEARLLNQFDSPKRREQVHNELKISDEVHEWDKKTNIDTRLKQQEELNTKGQTDKKTRFDEKFEEELNKESSKDQIHDQRYLDRYQRMSSYILETLSGFHPKTLKTNEVKTQAANIFRGHYDLFHSVLVTIGEIKEVIPDDNIKGQKRIVSNDDDISNNNNVIDTSCTVVK